ncbi:hypothetical protein [Cohnella yongneupensis]|uniref:Uncharacterized protein n=1 Tax=Cohnella yongneupensis TaxID=425006 RepID=A0ABW0QZQ5_9BACL
MEHDDKDNQSKEAEALLAERLTEGQQGVGAPEVEAVKVLSPRWEIRVQAERDPVVEETKLYRAMADEVDGRYDGKLDGK